MASRTRWWAAGLAAAGLMALPVNAAAQGTKGSPSSQSYGQSSAENKSPRYHLDQAKRVLDELSRSSGVSGSQTGSTTSSSTTGSGTTGSATTGSQSGSTMSGATDKASIVNELQRHFTQLEQAYERSSRQTSTSGATSGTSGATGSGTTGSGTTGSGTTGSGTTGSQAQSSDTSESWMTHYSRLNQVLDRINVPKTSTATGTSGSMSGTGSGTTGSGTTGSGTTGSGTTGSSGTGSSSRSGSSSIDPTTMSRLREFRLHIDNFHAAAMAEGSRR